MDPVNIGAHVVLTLQELVSREVNPLEPCVLTIGAFQAGDAGNILPESAVLRGSIRTFNNDVRNFIKQRTVELCEDTAKKFRAEAKVEFTSGVCPLINESAFTKEMHGSCTWALRWRTRPKCAAATTPMSCSTRTASTWVLLL